MAFMIIGKGRPLLEVVSEQAAAANANDGPNAHQFAMHAALDAVEEHLWSSQVMNLKQVDSFRGQAISAYVTASQVVLMLMHENKVGVSNLTDQLSRPCPIPT